MAIMASNGAVEPEGLAEAAGVSVLVRSVTEVEERRSVAEARRAPPVDEAEDWIWEAAYMLERDVRAQKYIPQALWLESYRCTAKGSS